MQTNQTCNSRCPLKLNRRSFLTTTVGALAATAAGCFKSDMFDLTSSLLDAQSLQLEPIKPARMRAVFVRPNVDKYWMGWPGAAYDIKARQCQYTDVLVKAAQKQEIDLQVISEPLQDDNAVSALLENLKNDPRDGLLVTSMCLHHPGYDSWGHTYNIAKNRGEIPTIVFSPMGTSFTGDLHSTRNIPGVFVGATQDVQWLGTGLRMLNTVHQMKYTRLCIAAGDKTEDRKIPVVGTTLHYIPNNRFAEEIKKVQISDEMRSIADYYIKHARKIIEPARQQLLDAVKNYVVCRRLMVAEKCHGFSMDCLGLVGSRTIQPPCLALSHLRDEGIVGACEADWPAAISSRLTHLLFQRPGFMQDPAPNTVNNTLMGAHCTCGIKLNGFDAPAEPYILRSHSESNVGVSPQVLWRLGQRVTVMKFTSANWWGEIDEKTPVTIILGTGTVVGNIDTPPSGGCRTSVELELDDVPDVRDTKGFHQLFIYGDLEDEFKAYCQLARIKVEHI